MVEATADPVGNDLGISETSILSTPPSTLERGDQPAWLAERRHAAWNRFLATPAPVITDQTWRFSKLKQLDFSSVGYAEESSRVDDLVDQSGDIEEVAARFVFVNESLVSHEVHDEGMEAQGVKVLPLAEALVDLGDVVENHFMAREAKLGSEKWAALHEASAESGVVVFVPKGVVVEKPIEIIHWVDGENVAIFPHTLIVAEELAQVSVVDQFLSADDTSSNWVIGCNDLVTEKGAKVGYHAFQRLNESSRAILLNNATAERDATTTSFTLNLGGHWVRTENMSYVAGEGANSYMLAISLPLEGQEFDQRTFQHHMAPHTVSDLLFKNALFGKSRTVFSGLIMVDEGAHFTDAYQTCRNLLNSEKAEANSMPGLEINADQVKCSHGSTSAQIDRDELFYFLARGIDESAARVMIIDGYTHEVTDKINDEQIEGLISKLVAKRLAQVDV